MGHTIYKKAIFSGCFSELFTYDEGLRIGFKAGERKKTVKGSKKIVRLDNFIRSKAKIKRLAWAHSGSFKTFITLTFAENIQDFDFANKKLDIFQKRLKRAFPNIMYLGVVEFQKRGAIHYHFLCSEFIKADKLANLWGQGFVKINKIRNHKNLGLYIVKYMTKDLFTERRFFMRKKYFFSKNLKSPIIITCQKVIDKIFNFAYNKIKLTKLFEAEFSIDFVGKIQYKLFDVEYLVIQ